MQVQVVNTVRTYTELTPAQYSAGLEFLKFGGAEINYEYSEEEGRQDFLGLAAPTVEQINLFESALAAAA